MVVERSIDDGVALLTLNRPERLNAWTGEMERAYFELLEDCGARDDVRVIVLTGAGRGFCAGADMDDLETIGTEGTDAADHDRRPITFALTVPKPIVAAVNGPVAGLGLVQALMCDIRFAAAGAKITTSFARLGLPAEHGVSWILPRLVGPARALDLLFSSRVVLAEEALELGLVNRVVPGERLLDETLDYARAIARDCSPQSLANMKRQIYADLDNPLSTALAEANRRMLDALQSDDFREGVAAFVERRQPEFGPLVRA